MTITYDLSKKKLKIYPPTNLSIDSEDLFWVEEEDDEPILLVLTIDKALSSTNYEEGTMYSNFLQNLYGSPFLLRDIVIL